MDTCQLSKTPLMLSDLIKREAGGHRWQRVPPTERKGRVHTSTVTVAVMQDCGAQGGEAINFALSDTDIKESVQRGSGPGGQHRNKTDSCVTLRHLPSGCVVRIDTRSQHQSRALARKILTERVAALMEGQQKQSVNSDRKRQVGSGMRGDKIRTYREQDGVVIDHRSERKAPLKLIERGELQLLTE